MYSLRDYYNSGDPELQPSVRIRYGKTHVFLYSEEDIERIKERIYDRYGDQPARGRPREFSKEDSDRRNKLRVRRRYWNLVAEEAEFMGDRTRYDKAMKFIENIQFKLEEMHND